MALIPLDTRVLLTAKPAEVDFANSINTGMELGNKIQQARQQRGLAHLLGNPAAYNANGQLDTNQAMGLIQQNYSGGLAGALRQQVAKYAQDQQKAALDAEKSRADMLKASSDAANTQQKTQIDRMRAINGSLAGALSGDPRNTAFMLSHAKAGGLLDDDTYSRTMEFVKANANNPEAISSLVKSLGIAGAQNPEQYVMPDANNTNTNQTSLTNNVLDNQTIEGNNIRTVNASIQNNKLDNTTSVANNVRTTNASLTNNQNTVGATMRGQDISAASAQAKKMQLPAPALKLVTQFQGNVDTADLAASKLTNLIPLVDTAKLGLWNNAASEGRNRLGYSTKESQAYERVKAGINDAANTILSAAKGVQTDGDAQRARSIVLASNSSDPKVVKQAINDLITLNDEIKSRNQNQIGGVYANYGLDPNEYFNSERNTGSAGKAGKNRSAPSLDSILFD